MRIATILAGAAAMALVAGASAQAAVTYGSSAASAHGYALTSGPKGSASLASGTDTDDSDTLLPGGLDVGAIRTATTVYRGVTQATATDAQDANITLSSPSSGTASFDGSSLAQVFVGGSSNAAYAGETDGAVDYLFSVDTASTLNLSYLLEETHDPSLSTSYYLISNPDSTDDLVGSAVLDQNSAGVVSFALAAGDYALLLVNTTNGDVDVQQSGVGVSGSSHDERFSFNITSAAPEPSAWALMIAGVAVAGGALRARRRGAAFA